MRIYLDVVPRRAQEGSADIILCKMVAAGIMVERLLERSIRIGHSNMVITRMRQ